MTAAPVSADALDVVIVDNGGANVASLQFALARLHCDARVTTDAETIREASHVILPGVGAAANAMRRLRSKGLHTVLPALTQPVLGICLGMQLLYDYSEEGDTQCLGVIPGKATHMTAAQGRPIPHMGWNRLLVASSPPLLEGIRTGTHAYFVHSYAVAVGPETVASVEYGKTLSAVVQQRNFLGTQFHPERSGRAGAEVLTNFLRVR